MNIRNSFNGVGDFIKALLYVVNPYFIVKEFLKVKKGYSNKHKTKRNYKKVNKEATGSKGN